MLTGPVLRNLKAHWPDCRISFLVKPRFAAALAGQAEIDEVIAYRGLGDALGRIRAAGFTHLLDLHGNMRSFLIRRLAGIANVSVYRKAALARRAFVALGLRSPVLEKHTVERYLEAMAAWGVPALHDRVLATDCRPSEPAGPRPRRVLVIQTAFLGDCLLTLPLLAELRRLFPEGRTSVLTQEKTKEVFAGLPGVSEVLVDRKRGEDGGIIGTWRLARRLRAGGFDAALIPHRSLRSALLATWAGIPDRIGFASSAGAFLLTRRVPFTWTLHDLERNLALLLAFSPEYQPGRVPAPPSPAPDPGVVRLLSEAGVGSGDRLVGVHPGSTWPTKRWLTERYEELCRRLGGEGFKVVLVGGANDRLLCAELATRCGAVDLSGRSLGDLRGLMSRLSLFVTNDSGPMHVAAAAGVPTLAIFGPTTRELGFFPYGPGHRVLEHDLSCRPCSLHGGRSCPEGHFLCMRLTTVQDAFDAAREMLAARASP